MPIDIFWVKIFTIGTGSAVLGLWFVHYLRKKGVPTPARNSKIRLRLGGTSYPSMFLGAREGGWAVSMPSRTDLMRPIHQGEFLQLVSPHERGVLIMDTVVRCNAGVLVVERPDKWRIEDRREDLRINEVGHLATRLDGDRAALEDISPKGARIRLRDSLGVGQRVRVDVAGFEDSLYGWVLSCTRMGERYVARIRFEEETDMWPLMKAS